LYIGWPWQALPSGWWTTHKGGVWCDPLVKFWDLLAFLEWVKQLHISDLVNRLTMASASGKLPTKVLLLVLRDMRFRRHCCCVIDIHHAHISENRKYIHNILPCCVVNLWMNLLCSVNCRFFLSLWCVIIKISILAVLNIENLTRSSTLWWGSLMV